MTGTQEHILSYDGLCVSYGGAQAVRGFSLCVDPNQIVGLVGESGSGKSTVLKAAAGLLGRNGRIDGGDISYRGTSLRFMPRKDIEKLRGAGISYVFQDPTASLDPLFKVGVQFDETIKAHWNMDKEEMRDLEVSFLEAMGFDDPQRILASYPSNLSGGMCQRVVLAMALACRSELILADEPTSALDVTVQAQVVKLLKDIRDNRGVSIVIASHNIAVIANMADVVGVMLGGVLVEFGTCDEVLRSPAHPYTRELIAAIPKANGALPQASSIGIRNDDATGDCPYRTRCQMRYDECEGTMARTQLSPSHWTMCPSCQEVG